MKKILILLLIYFPALLLFIIADVDFNLLEPSYDLGLLKHIILYSFLMLTVLILQWLIFRKLFKSKSHDSEDPLLNQNTLRGGIFVYVYLLLTFCIFVASSESSDYGRWLRGIRELDYVEEVDKKTSLKEEQYINEAIEISNQSSDLVRTTTLRYYNKRKALIECIESSSL